MKNHNDLLTPIEKRLLMDSHHEHKIQALVSPLLSLPPATKLGQGYVFTRVCDSVHRGVSTPVRAGIHTPMGRYTPGQTSPWADTPRQTSPG